MSGAGARLLSDAGPVRLGPRIGRGGEGEVFAVADAPDLAAKLYRPEIAQTRAAKIRAMVAARLSDAMRLVAFPGAALHDHRGAFRGFLMPRVAQAEPIHELYAPGARKRAFPEADNRFLVRAALNAARAVAAAHQAGCVIGDVNHSGFLIAPDALVSLIDADSFQFDDGRTLHLCRVGVPEYTPPELQGRALGAAARTPDHDAFGLAVLVFQLLFLGRHPYAGVSRDGDDLPTADAIAGHDFAYGARATRLKPPPGALRLHEIAPQTAALLERAFAPDTAGRRPTAQDWVAALGAHEAALAPCRANPRHHNPLGGADCPWCRIERSRRTALFPAPGAPGSTPRVAPRTALRARCEAVALPDVFAYAPPAPLPSSAPSPPGARAIWGGRIEAFVLAVMMGCGAFLTYVAPQSFWMCIPVYWYGVGPVGDVLSPRRAARRALAKLDRQLKIEIGRRQDRADLDSAWLLKADILGRIARGGRANLARAAQALPKLEAMAQALEAERTRRADAVERLLARREQLVAQVAAKGDAPPDPPTVTPRRLRATSRERMARALRPGVA